MVPLMTQWGLFGRLTSASGKAKPHTTAEMALRLEKGLGGAAQTWLAMQSEYNLAQVRRAAIKVSALRRARAKRA